VPDPVVRQDDVLVGHRLRHVLKKLRCGAPVSLIHELGNDELAGSPNPPFHDGRSSFRRCIRRLLDVGPMIPPEQQLCRAVYQMGNGCSRLGGLSLLVSRSHIRRDTKPCISCHKSFEHVVGFNRRCTRIEGMFGRLKYWRRVVTR
jgi:hypothetical protein